MFRYTLTFRYLRMRFLCILSILGVAVGVMVLMIAMSVMSGFLAEVKNLIQGVHADLEYLPGNKRIPQAQLEATLKKIDPRIQHISPHLEREVLVCSEHEKWSGGMLIGIDFPQEVQTTNIAKFLHTPKKQIWDEIRSVSREELPFSWSPLAFEQKGHWKNIYIKAIQGKEKFTIRIQLNDSDRVRDYSINATVPASAKEVPEKFKQWIQQAK